MKIRRLRARQIRELLSEPDAVDLETFNSDVWVLYSGIYLNGKKIDFAAFDNADAEHLARYESAKFFCYKFSGLIGVTVPK